jgi:hypothetical protein
MQVQSFNIMRGKEIVSVKYPGRYSVNHDGLQVSHHFILMIGYLRFMIFQKWELYS